MAKILDIHAGTTTEILLLNIFHLLEEILKELKKEGKDDQPRKTKKVNTK
jgi:hypothetical protein